MDKELRKEIGKFLIDVAKLIIGGVVLLSVLKIQGLTNETTVVGGQMDLLFISLVMLGFAILTFIFIKYLDYRESKKEHNEKS